MTFGTNWQPDVPVTYWNGTEDQTAKGCTCGGNTLSDGVHSSPCTTCMLVGTEDDSGGASNPDGTTYQYWGCF